MSVRPLTSQYDYLGVLSTTTSKWCRTRATVRSQLMSVNMIPHYTWSSRSPSSPSPSLTPLPIHALPSPHARPPTTTLLRAIHHLFYAMTFGGVDSSASPPRITGYKADTKEWPRVGCGGRKKEMVVVGFGRVQLSRARGGGGRGVMHVFRYRMNGKADVTWRILIGGRTLIA